MADSADEPKGNIEEPESNAESSPPISLENNATSENAGDAGNEKIDETSLPPANEAGEPNKANAVDAEAENVVSSGDQPKIDNQTVPVPNEDDGEHAIPPKDDAAMDIAPPEDQSTAAAAASATETSPNSDIPKEEPAPPNDEVKEEPQQVTETLPDKTEDTAEQLPTQLDPVEEESTAGTENDQVETSPQNTQDIADQTDSKPPEMSLHELVKKASEGLSKSSKSKLKNENASLTKRLYDEQIKTGEHNRLTSVMEDEDGTTRLVRPGSVPHWNTVNISLAGKRPMPSEKCRRGEHNCFESAAARRERALSASLSQGLYPDFMRLNPKLNEFVAASILEKLRLKGLAAPLHLYRGRYLPSDVLAEMVLKPRKKKVTDRYYFGYVPPPNRPRLDTAFRRYLQQFAERHRAEEGDLCYSYAMKKVRKLAGQSTEPVSLPETLAEVIRAQEEPGFGVKRLRRPHTAVI